MVSSYSMEQSSKFRKGFGWHRIQLTFLRFYFIPINAEQRKGAGRVSSLTLQLTMEEESRIQGDHSRQLNFHCLLFFLSKLSCHCLSELPMLRDRCKKNTHLPVTGRYLSSYIGRQFSIREALRGWSVSSPLSLPLSF